MKLSNITFCLYQAEHVMDLKSHYHLLSSVHNIQRPNSSIVTNQVDGSFLVIVTMIMLPWFFNNPEMEANNLRLGKEPEPRMKHATVTVAQPSKW
jgi:hypothetical protein